jgi:hypothetical protein
MNKTIKIQFEMPVDRVGELEDLMREVGVKAKEDMFNHGLHILVWAINERKAGNIICSLHIKENLYTELESPVLDAIAVD